MSIEEAIKTATRDLLIEDGYCKKSDVEKIAKKYADQARQDLSNEMDEVRGQCQKLLEMNDRLWDTIHKISSPKFPSLRQFFKFRWLKFWK